jgi:hypothetical protein
MKAGRGYTQQYSADETKMAKILWLCDCTQWLGVFFHMGMLASTFFDRTTQTEGAIWSFSALLRAILFD